MKLSSLVWESSSPVDIMKYDIYQETLSDQIGNIWSVMEIELMGGYYEIWYETVWSDSLIWKSSSPVDMISDSFSQSMLAGGLARTTHRIWKKMIDWKKRRFLMFYSSMCIYISCAKPYNLDWGLRIDFQEHLSMWSRLRIIISWIHDNKINFIFPNNALNWWPFRIYFIV